MKLVTLFRQSIKAIFSNKGRSFLTVLGIIIGIASVIALISLGAGVRANISQRISKLGATNITVVPGGGFGNAIGGGGGVGGTGGAGGMGGRGAGGGGFGGGGAGRGFGEAASTLTVSDLQSLADRSAHPLISQVSGQISGTTVLQTPGGDRRYAVVGTSETYPSIHGLAATQGSFFTKADVDNRAKVIALGSQMAADLSRGTNAVGQTLSVSGTDYRVVGILGPASESGLGNPNNQAYIPYSSAFDTFGVQTFGSITAQATTEGAVDAAKQDIRRTLLANHKIADEKLADFSAFSSADLLSTISSVTGVLTSVLAGIAAISLVVGGIGIMNIMLVSVTERTREIGLRKAVGARTSDILVQFIIEAVVLTITGGIVGIALGVLVGRVAANAIGFAPVVTGGSIALAVGVSSLVGLLFGVYPAAKAAMLDPIQALRFE